MTVIRDYNHIFSKTKISIYIEMENLMGFFKGGTKNPKHDES